MDFLTVLRAKLQTLIDERAAAKAELDAILAAPTAEGRDLNADESAKFAAARDAVKRYDVTEISDADNGDKSTALLQARIAELEELESRQTAAAKADAVPGAPATKAVVTSEPRSYREDNDPKGRRFLADVAARHMGDWDAGERLARHNREEMVERRTSQLDTRAAGTAAFAGLVVPQYLVNLYAPAAAAGRQFANVCRHVDLPEQGMTVNISRITTATSAAAQSAENAAVSETNIDDTLLTESVFTVAGQQTLSRQAVERGTFTEDVTVDDLIRRYHTALDSKLINDATTGLTNVAQANAYTDASPTAAELYPKVLAAQAAMEAVMLDQAANPDRVFAVMHSRRWAWMQSQMTSTWPFITQPGYDPRAGGRNDGQPYTARTRGQLPSGTGVVVDNNIATNLGAGTNEDEIYVVNADECFLWEDPSAPMFIRTEATPAASLGILFVLYGYAAYTFRRYTNGHQKVSGTGLVTPTF